MIEEIFYLLVFISITVFAMLIFDIIATNVYKIYRKIRYLKFKNR